MCAILVVVCFVLGAVLMGASGVESLIPETGRLGLDWIADVDAASGIFFAGAWLIVLMGIKTHPRHAVLPLSLDAVQMSR